MPEHRPADTVRSPLDRFVREGDSAVDRARRRGEEAGRVRLRQMEVTLVIAVQSGLAAALAALLSQRLLGEGSHVFAPAAAVGTIAAAIGQRARRTFELLAGVGIGLIVGDLLLYWLGFGPWQTGLVVTLAIATALLVAGRSGALVGQAGGTAVLIATLSPLERNLEVPRIFDAAVGSVVGLVVVALLLPINPMRVLDRAAVPVFGTLAAQWHEMARAVTERDAERSIRALERLRGLDPDVARLHESLSGAEEVVTLAPARWHRRRDYHRYARGAEHLERVIGTGRVVARHVATAIQYDEPLPAELADSATRLGQAITMLHVECKGGRAPDRTRELVLEGAGLAGRASARGVGVFGESVVTDLRTAASDVLRATGFEPGDANTTVRRAAGVGLREVRAGRVGRGSENADGPVSPVRGDRPVSGQEE